MSSHSEAKTLTEINPTWLITLTLHGEQKEFYGGVLVLLGRTGKVFACPCPKGGCSTLS